MDTDVLGGDADAGLRCGTVVGALTAGGGVAGIAGALVNGRSPESTGTGSPVLISSWWTLLLCIGRLDADGSGEPRVELAEATE